MTTNALLDHVSKTAARRARVNRRLLREAVARAEEIEQEREADRRSLMKTNLLLQRATNERIERACSTILALSALGQSKQFQKFLSVHREPLVLYGGEKAISPGYDMGDVYWKWTSFISLTETFTLVRNCCATSRDYGSTYQVDSWGFTNLIFPYDLQDSFLIKRHLRILATAYPLDLEEVERSDNINLTYSSEVLFEMLVELADPKVFNRLIRNSLG